MMRKALSAAALLLALTCSAYAGEMPNGTPAPPPRQSVQVPATDGVMDTPLLVQIALNLLALF